MTGAVCIVGVWQSAHPMSLNTSLPRIALALGRETCARIACPSPTLSGSFQEPMVEFVAFAPHAKREQHPTIA